MTPPPPPPPPRSPTSKNNYGEQLEDFELQRVIEKDSSPGMSPQIYTKRVNTKTKKKNNTVKPVKTTCTGAMCVVMGGKRRTKRIRRKSKKNRITRYQPKK